METLLNKYSIKPIVGIIPDNMDLELLKYKKVNDFWKKAKMWENNGWTIAMHGYQHLYKTKEGGINPVNLRSEFAGLEYELQQECTDY